MQEDPTNRCIISKLFDLITDDMFLQESSAANRTHLLPKGTELGSRRRASNFNQNWGLKQTTVISNIKNEKSTYYSSSSTKYLPIFEIKHQSFNQLQDSTKSLLKASIP